MKVHQGEDWETAVKVACQRTVPKEGQVGLSKEEKRNRKIEKKKIQKKSEARREEDDFEAEIEQESDQGKHEFAFEDANSDDD